MNDFNEQLAASVDATASFDSTAVAERVTRRRRTRRAAFVAAGCFVVAVSVGSALVIADGDDEPDLEAVDDPPTTVPADTPADLAPATEDPVGADGVTGQLSDFHVETNDTYGFVECGADGEPGPPDDARAVELDAVIDALRTGGLHEQPFVVSSGGPQSIWGVPSIGLSSRYEPTLAWLAERADAAEVCVEFPEFGVRNLPPELAPVAVTEGFTVTADGCEPKGEWVEPFLRLVDGRAELGIAIGRGQQNFTDDCPFPTTHLFQVRTTGDYEAVVATSPGTLVFDAAEPGELVDFTFDLVNTSSLSIGDDLIAQHADDSTVQFQVSDIFSGSPVAGTVGEVATDQWPVTGSGTIAIPEGVPAGTYFVRLIDAPELNGTLEVVGASACLPPSDGPQTGWVLPDLDGGCVVDVADWTTGAVLIAMGDSYRPLLDAAGDPVSVPVDGAMSFACDHEWGLVMRYRDADSDGNASPEEFDHLVVINDVGAWSPSVADVLGETPLPERGAGCVQFAKG